MVYGRKVKAVLCSTVEVLQRSCLPSHVLELLLLSSTVLYKSGVPRPHRGYAYSSGVKEGGGGGRAICVRIPSWNGRRRECFVRPEIVLLFSSFPLPSLPSSPHSFVRSFARPFVRRIVCEEWRQYPPHLLQYSTCFRTVQQEKSL